MKRHVVACLGLLFPLASLAHDLQAPGVVEAGSDGSFSYEWVFTAGPGAALLAGAGWDGLVNVSGGRHGDCFCEPVICTREAGETTTFSVQGKLADPTQQGSVSNWVALCGDDPSLQVSTVVMPFGTVPVEATTWSCIKALYREHSP
jgi:hypothetical protein